MTPSNISKALVVTTINYPTDALLELAKKQSDWNLYIVGDLKTPVDWSLQGATYISVDEQKASEFQLARSLPWNHYCRKNIGYLTAFQSGAHIIAETDDDNFPNNWPPNSCESTLEAELVSKNGWVNVYKYFTQADIWARGLPLESVDAPITPAAEKRLTKAAVHQYLASGDPDVDALYRLTLGRTDHEFEDRNIVLDVGAATPFNSQSTIWFSAALALMYLPCNVSFRMTDIWRSFVAQACLWAAGERVAYLGNGVTQIRNEHDLVRDLTDELIGYRRNNEIMQGLLTLSLSPNPENMTNNLLACYDYLAKIDIVPPSEMPLVEAWCSDVDEIFKSRDINIQ